ncbi:MAG: beta-ketoacyl-[acyl-carrier-protein] synthase family protein, partial [Gammaproteobacteria bacterium]
MNPLAITAFTATSALGAGLESHRRALAEARGGLRPCDFEEVDLETWIGRVPELESLTLPTSLAAWDCRNNRLAWLGLGQDGFMDALEQARARYGSDRIGVFIGTSTSGVEQTERAYAARDANGALPGWFDYRRTQNTFSLAAFLLEALDLQGPAQVVSTACSSSAKVFATAARHIQAGVCDAALVGGVDSLCRMTLYGFNSLQLVSAEPCRPADAERDGISIGEAAGFALLEADREAPFRFLGCGESSDAWHMSSPHPEGEGAARAMQAALAEAGLAPDEIDFIHLHGTGTPANDLAEDRAVCRLFGNRTPCASTKGFTGHTLGAAGILGAVIGLLAIEQGNLPPSLNTRRLDPRLEARYQLQPEAARVRRVLV